MSLFAGLFRSVLANVPAHLGGIGTGALITLQQSGPALGVAILPRFTPASIHTAVIDA